MIYFIQAEGVATGNACVMTRLHALQTGNASKLEVIACVPGELTDEAKLHVRFASSRVGGEWFRLSPELLRYMTFERIARGVFEEGVAAGRKALADEYEQRTSEIAKTYPLPEPTRSAAKYPLGSLVEHPEYGVGIVDSVQDWSAPALDRVRIRFPGHGLKTFLIEKVPMRVIRTPRGVAAS